MIEFLYFDLGNVLVHFDHRRAARQVAELCDVSADQAWDVLFTSGLQFRHEAGAIDEQELFETFCRQIGRRPERQAFLHAISDIFEINPPVAAIVAALGRTGYRLGILSNTCPSHWRACASGRFALIPSAFEIHALSFEVGAAKPDAKFYRQAIAMTGLAAEQIFFVDDIPKNVEAARELGINAALFTTPAALADDLRSRGLRFNF